MGCAIQPSGNRLSRDDDTSIAYIKVSPSGNLMIETGESDIGQGAYFTFRKIVSKEMGIPLDRIQVSPIDTDFSPRGYGAFASRITVMGGNAVIEAAKDLKKQILLAASRIHNLSLEHLEFKDGEVLSLDDPLKKFTIGDITQKAISLAEGPPLLGRGFYNPPSTKADPNTKYGNIAPSYSFATHVAEVEIDPETGLIKIVGYWAVHDSGRILNPLGAEGQVEGGIIQGLGTTISEEMIFVEGRPVNANFRDYPLLTAFDVPPLEFCFIEQEDPRGPFGAKGLGEPMLVPCAPAVANAIFDAIGIRVKKIPILPEDIFFKIREKTNAF